MSLFIKDLCLFIKDPCLPSLGARVPSRERSVSMFTGDAGSSEERKEGKEEESVPLSGGSVQEGDRDHAGRRSRGLNRGAGENGIEARVSFARSVSTTCER